MLLLEVRRRLGGVGVRDGLDVPPRVSVVHGGEGLVVRLGLRLALLVLRAGGMGAGGRGGGSGAAALPDDLLILLIGLSVEEVTGLEEAELADERLCSDVELRKLLSLSLSWSTVRASPFLPCQPQTQNSGLETLIRQTHTRQVYANNKTHLAGEGPR